MKPFGEFILAASSFDEQVKRATQGHLNARDVLIGLTIALVVGAVIVFWIFLRSRKQSNDQDRERLSQMMRSQSSNSSSTATEDGVHRRRKRRRRRDHRPRNPSLSQTGGLPPPRPDDQLPKF
jgi:hypothetical protein